MIVENDEDDATNRAKNHASLPWDNDDDNDDDDDDDEYDDNDYDDDDDDDDDSLYLLILHYIYPARYHWM